MHHTESNAKIMYLSFFSFHSLLFILYFFYFYFSYNKTSFDDWDNLFGIASLKCFLLVSMGLINLYVNQ